MFKVLVNDGERLIEYVTDTPDDVVSNLKNMGHYDCSVSIVNLEKDYNYLLRECYVKRVAEYPPIGDQLDAVMKMIDGDETEAKALSKKCKEVKQKYPKPAKELK